MRRIARKTKAAMVKCYALEMTRQHRHLLPPAKVVSAGAMGQHKRRPLAMDFIVEFDSIDSRRWHSTFPLSTSVTAPRYQGLLLTSKCSAGQQHKGRPRSEEHTSELQSRENIVCR